MNTALRKKLAFVIHGLTGGGAERVATILFKEWLLMGYEVTLITYDEPVEDFYEIPTEVKRVSLLGKGNSTNPFIAVRNNLRRIKRLRYALKQSSANTILSFLTTTNILVIIASLGLRKRVVISERNDLKHDSTSRPWRILRLASYRWADIVTANLGAAIDQMRGYVPNGKLKLINNPVALPREHKIQNRQKIVLTVGRLTAQKNHAVLVSAIQALESNFSGWKLHILGEGPLRENLEAQIKKYDLNSHIKLIGAVPSVLDYYQAAAIFVLTSHYEGTPNVLLEAMSNRLPCIVADCLPGALELIIDGDTGLVYKAGDSGDLAGKIKLLMDNEQFRAELGDRAYGVIQDYSPASIAETWDAVLFPGGGSQEHVHCTKPNKKR